MGWMGSSGHTSEGKKVYHKAAPKELQKGFDKHPFAKSQQKSQGLQYAEVFYRGTTVSAQNQVDWDNEIMIIEKQEKALLQW